MRRAFLVVLLLSSGAGCGSKWHVGGSVGVAEKYDSNLDLEAREDPGAVRAGLAPQIDGSIQYGYQGESFDFEHGVRVRLEAPHHDVTLGRLYQDDELYLGYNIDPQHTISLTNLSDCFLDADDERYDVCRDNALLGYRWAFADAWRWQIGVEFHTAEYIDNEQFDYDSWGLFTQFRYLPNYRTSWWTRITALDYVGALRGQVSDTLAAPSDGHRVSQDFGFDWTGESVSFMTTARLEFDNSHDTELQTVDGRALRDDDLETDSQFNYRKASANVLVSWQLSRDWNLGGYGEAMYLSFVKDMLREAEGPDRQDLRYLLSGWVSMRMVDDFFVRLRVSYRENVSTVGSEDFQNFIGALGVEQRW